MSGWKYIGTNPRADVVPWSRPAKNGLIVSFTRSQRLYNDKKWPNPIVLKLEGVEYRAE